MSRIFYDVGKRAITGAGMPSSGIMGSMSYARLLDVLQLSGETRPGERVTHIEFTERGIVIRYEPQS